MSFSHDDYTARAIDYAVRVTDGAVDACRYVQQACQRFLDDIGRIGDDEDFRYYLNRERADEVCAFIETLRHVKGRWAKRGELLRLEDWQCFIVVNIFGWLDVDSGFRRFLVVYIEVPRKNGKSILAAAIGLAMLVFDEEFGPEVYSGATSEKQAWEVFRPARLMAFNDPQIRNDYGIKVNAKSLATPDDGGRFEPVIGNPGDGASPSCAIVDEYHEHKTSDLRDTMETGMGGRDQPLMFIITTAGADMGGPCYQQRDELVQTLKRSSVDESLFGMIYTIDMPETEGDEEGGDRWDDLASIKKANPNYGVSLNARYIEQKLEGARRSPEKQAAFKTKHANIWVGAKLAWMNMLAYQACRRKALAIEQFSGRRCAVALDLATKEDVASMAALFPLGGERYAAFCRHYVPEDKVYGEGAPTRYKGWAAAGWLQTTPGNRIDFEYIKRDMRQFKSKYHVFDVSYDPFQATQFAGELLDEGFPMVEYGATVKNFSEPMKELDTLIATKRIEFEMDPVLMWMFGNVVAKKDLKDNIFPNKERAENKIDGVVALIMALGRILTMPDQFLLFPPGYEVPSV